MEILVQFNDLTNIAGYYFYKGELFTGFAHASWVYYINGGSIEYFSNIIIKKNNKFSIIF